MLYSLVHPPQQPRAVDESKLAYPTTNPPPRDQSRTSPAVHVRKINSRVPLPTVHLVYPLVFLRYTEQHTTCQAGACTNNLQGFLLTLWCVTCTELISIFRWSLQTSWEYKPFPWVYIYRLIAHVHPCLSLPFSSLGLEQAWEDHIRACLSLPENPPMTAGSFKGESTCQKPYKNVFPFWPSCFFTFSLPTPLLVPRLTLVYIPWAP